MGKLARPKISETLIGVGDSHLDNFTFFCAATCRIPGATAYGLANPESESLYPMVEGLKRLDDKKIKLAIFRKIK